MINQVEVGLVLGLIINNNLFLFHHQANKRISAEESEELDGKKLTTATN